MLPELADDAHRGAAARTPHEAPAAEWGMECALPYLTGLLAAPDPTSAGGAAAPLAPCHSDPCP